VSSVRIHLARVRNGRERFTITYVTLATRMLPKRGKRVSSQQAAARTSGAIGVFETRTRHRMDTSRMFSAVNLKPTSSGP